MEWATAPVHPPRLLARHRGDEEPCPQNEHTIVDWDLHSVAVSCWFRRSYDGLAMWRLYGRSASIAIESTGNHLLHASSGRSVTGPWRVQYKGLFPDDGRPGVDGLPVATALLTKNDGFQYEQEVRFFAALTPGETRTALLRFPPSGTPPKDPASELPGTEAIANGPGIEVEVDVQTLIERVVLSPDFDPWARDVIRDISEEHGVDPAKVVLSRVNRPVRSHVCTLGGQCRARPTCDRSLVTRLRGPSLSCEQGQQ